MSTNYFIYNSLKKEDLTRHEKSEQTITYLPEFPYKHTA